MYANYLKARDKVISYRKGILKLIHCYKIYGKYPKKREIILRRIERLKTKFRRTVIEYVETTDWSEKENTDPDLELLDE